MEKLLFLLAGLPAAFLAERLILRFTRLAEDLDDEEDGGRPQRRLPWQDGPWTARLRWAGGIPIPGFMAVAASRFDLLQAAGVSLLVAALLICTATDLLRYRVPNAVTYPGVLLALTAALVMPDANLPSAVLAGGVVILVLFLAGVVGRRQAVPYAPFLALAAVIVVLTQGAAFAPL